MPDDGDEPVVAPLICQVNKEITLFGSAISNPERINAAQEFKSVYVVISSGQAKLLLSSSCAGGVTEIFVDEAVKFGDTEFPITETFPISTAKTAIRNTAIL